MPYLLLCSYKVHKIHKKRIEPSEHVNPVQTPSAADSMQREHREESNVRWGSIQAPTHSCWHKIRDINFAGDQRSLTTSVITRVTKHTTQFAFTCAHFSFNHSSFEPTHVIDRSQQKLPNNGYIWNKKCQFLGQYSDADMQCTRQRLWASGIAMLLCALCVLLTLSFCMSGRITCLVSGSGDLFARDMAHYRIMCHSRQS